MGGHAIGAGHRAVYAAKVELGVSPSMRGGVQDCDGVIWRSNELIPGARDALSRLREEGKQVYFLTNAGMKSREQFLSKFVKLGIDVNPQEVMSAAGTARAAPPSSLGSYGRARSRSAGHVLRIRGRAVPPGPWFS